MGRCPASRPTRAPPSNAHDEVVGQDDLLLSAGVFFPEPRDELPPGLQALLRTASSAPRPRRGRRRAAANKDGGAHVDEKLEQNYERLAASGALGMYMSQITVGDGTTIDLPPLENAHLVYLRQMGYEVLRSFDMRLLLVIT